MCRKDSPRPCTFALPRAPRKIRRLRAFRKFFASTKARCPSCSALCIPRANWSPRSSRTFLCGADTAVRARCGRNPRRGKCLAQGRYRETGRYQRSPPQPPLGTAGRARSSGFLKSYSFRDLSSPRKLFCKLRVTGLCELSLWNNKLLADFQRIARQVVRLS